MKKLFFVFVIGLMLVTATPSLAQESSDSGSLDPNIKEKLQTLQAEIASKAATLKQEINQKLINRSYVGLIKTKSSDSITISTHSGDKSVKVNQDTDYLSQSGKKISIDSLNEGDYIASLGDVDESEVLTARRTIKLSSQVQDNKKLIFGEVDKVSSNEIDIHDKDNKNVAITIEKYTDMQSGDKDIDTTDITNGSFIEVLGNSSDNSNMKARFIYLFPKSSASSFSASFKSLTVSTPRQ